MNVESRTRAKTGPSYGTSTRARSWLSARLGPRVARAVRVQTEIHPFAAVLRVRLRREYSVFGSDACGQVLFSPSCAPRLGIRKVAWWERVSSQVSAVQWVSCAPLGTSIR
ncbi:hypothetical protein [Streptomyces pluripotens]|uniref:hypothetical protein n=1 Tax=Streptomyces pluripotens TaxID=1355015 RepID=UPI00131C534D|nr:hypothetical protein [Streptomyces pluripotens]